MNKLVNECKHSFRSKKSWVYKLAIECKLFHCWQVRENSMGMHKMGLGMGMETCKQMMGSSKVTGKLVMESNTECYKLGMGSGNESCKQEMEIVWRFVN